MLNPMSKLWMRCARLKAAAILLPLMLSACASKPLDYSTDCPKPLPTPASLAEPSSPAASEHSQKVQSWLQKVQTLLSDAQQKKTP